MRTAHIHGSIPAAHSVLRAEYEGNSDGRGGEECACRILDLTDELGEVLVLAVEHLRRCYEWYIHNNV